jgi:hypothetical protein
MDMNSLGSFLKNFMLGQGKYDPYGGLKEGEQGPTQPLPWYASMSPAMSPLGLKLRSLMDKRQVQAQPQFKKIGNMYTGRVTR